MPRFGHNPLKNTTQVHTPKDVTVCTIVYIPLLSGYWAHSLDVLKVCLSSLIQNTQHPFDLLVFDNGSCTEVRDYLSSLHDEGIIQFLFLSQHNVGKIGAWNLIFPGAPGKFIAYADSDVQFYPGWLEASLKVFDAYEEAGMVTARPGRSYDPFIDGYNSATLRFAEVAEDITVERGDLVPHQVLREHAESLGRAPTVFCEEWPFEDVRIHRRGVAVYAHANHYQFVMPKSVAQRFVPLDVNRPVGVERTMDQALNDLGFLRLSLDQPHVRHIGNLVDKGDADFGMTSARKRKNVGTVRNGYFRKVLRSLATYRYPRWLLNRMYHYLFHLLTSIEDH